MATVVDASALGDFLRGVRRNLASPPLHVPALCDLEIASQLRTLIRRGGIVPATATTLLELYLALPLRRHPHHPLLQRVFELRDNFTPYDASYVALAERLQMPLLTDDQALARAVRAHAPHVTLL